MTILSRRNFNNIEILKVSSLSGVTALPGSLAKLSSSGATYKTLDGSSWSFLASQSGSGPQGAQGSQGNTGQQGAAGSQGPQGAQGSQGSQGSQGIQGDEGHQGAQGAQGATGSVSAEGLVLVQSISVPSDTSSVTFSGLDGDSHKNYLLFSRIIVGGSAATPYYVQLEFNGSSSDSNIKESSRKSLNASTSLARRSNKHLMLDSASSGSYYFLKTNVKASSSYARYVHEIGAGYFSSAAVTGSFDNSTRWADTTNNLSSLNISSYLSSSNASASAISSGSSFHLYRYEV